MRQLFGESTHGNCIGIEIHPINWGTEREQMTCRCQRISQLLSLLKKSKLIRSNLKKYQSATQNRKSCVPGSANIKKILQVINAHFKIGELFMEYLYGDCSTKITEQCSFCSNKGWTSPVPMKHIRQSVPDPENPTHFKSVNQTPNTTKKCNLECQMI